MADQPKPATATADRVHATVGGDQLELIESGTERIETLLQIIAEAKESVRILFYIFDSDDSGRRVRDALVEAAGRGATVHLLVDGFGCSTAEPDFFQPLKDAGGDFCVFNPRYGSRYLVRNHQKLVVADDRIGLIGGPISRTATSPTRATSAGGTCGCGSRVRRWHRRENISIRSSAGPSGRTRSYGNYGGSLPGTRSTAAFCSGSSAGHSAASIAGRPHCRGRCRAPRRLASSPPISRRPGR
ncbi:hypothetical protein H9L15_07030 [Sphingomonas daechungensis]|uniref:Phospholipase D n=1 Tax=Sphingomonas daechungensis TaxID=1176646 RepID=A0ABX6T691_9SPHN|nr:hypothetical protein H9L15_07030 [Sphingomonas daechungensis]